MKNLQNLITPYFHESKAYLLALIQFPEQTIKSKTELSILSMTLLMALLSTILGFFTSLFSLGWFSLVALPMMVVGGFFFAAMYFVFCFVTHIVLEKMGKIISFVELAQWFFPIALGSISFQLFGSFLLNSIAMMILLSLVYLIILLLAFRWIFLHRIELSEDQTHKMIGAYCIFFLLYFSLAIGGAAFTFRSVYPTGKDDLSIVEKIYMNQMLQLSDEERREYLQSIKELKDLELLDETQE
ncbi:MAG: hypothetical protein R3A11_05430 [Bdellovibrionota bacterium]